MQFLGRYYVRYFKQVYKRTGTLRERRFKSTLVDSDNYFLVMNRYIELNPVRADMVAHPAEYTWSSYQHNGAGKVIEFITKHDLYTHLGTSPEQRQAQYRSLFESNIAPYALEEIKTATDKMWGLGNEKFKQ
ncbi:hypothetical protein [Pseudoalteromonas aurantia]|uniref:hypothetical protein n=1 Tax=Pseudoalteromonas aurantia TaxID=43654 RepID=UPI00269B5EE3